MNAHTQPSIGPLLLKELIAGLALVGLPYWLHLAPAVVGFFFAALAYRLVAVSKPGLMPGKKPLAFLTLACGAITWKLAGGIFGVSGGSNLLLAGVGLKLLELRQQRDVYVVTALAYLLAITRLLFDQDMLSAAYQLAMLILLTAVLIGIHSAEHPAPLRKRLKHALAMMLQALPLAALLFVLAPRLSSPLWSWSKDKSAVSGLSDRLEPGSVSQVSLSNDVAFRVNFTGPLPARQQLYWRGPVFWWTNGTRWEMRSLSPLKHAPSNYGGDPVDYSIILEPHGYRWLLALEHPQQFPSDARLSGDLQLLAKDEVRERRLYRLRSFPTYRFGALSALERRMALQLPKDFSPRLQALVDGWRSNRDDAQVAKQALAYFHDNGYSYTLEPPALADHPIERFLLETKQGYCEHYATAMAVLMRMAGIPARVVTGYQGGLWNEVGQFLEVRQSDAHAWTEIWLDDGGWTRVDPTAAVAPNRIAPPDAASTIVGEASTDIQAGRSVNGRPLTLQRIGLYQAALDHAWHRWILGYDRDTRERLLQWLGVDNWKKSLLWLLLAMSLIAAPFLFWLLRASRQEYPKDPVARLYERYCNKLEKRGLRRIPSEGPLHFANRISKENPSLSSQIMEITQLYLDLRYGPAGNAKSMARFRQLVNQLL